MQQKFLSNLVLMVVLNLLVKPIAIFGIDAVVQNRVGSEEYGFYFSLLNFTYLFNILLDVGINNYTTRNVAQHPDLAHKYIGKVLGVRVMLFVLYTVISLSVAWLIGYSDRAFSVLYFLIINQFLIILIAYIRSHFAGMLLFRTDALLSVLDRALLIGICGTVLYTSLTTSAFQIEWFVWMQTAAYLITCGVGAVLLVKQLGLPRLRIQRAFSLVLLRQSIPFAILILLMMLYTRADSVMLERLSENGQFEAGIYAQGYRLLDAFFMFAMIVTNLLFPLFAGMLKRGEQVRPLFAMSARLLVWGSTALAGFLYWNAAQVLDWIYTDDVEQSALPFQYLMLTFAGMCASLISGTLLTAKGDLRLLNRIAFVGFLANVGLNLILIPRWGAVGAALATLSTQCIVSVVQFVYVYRQLNWKAEAKTIFGFLGFAVVVFALLWLASHWGVHLLFQLAMLVILVLAFKVIDIRAIKQALKTDLSSP